MMKYTLAVPTYNRLVTLEKMAETLSLTHGLDNPNIHIRVYDDRSSDYDLDTLRKLFPKAVSVERRKRNLGANKNMLQMYRDFLETDDDVYIHTESDLLFHPDWLTFVGEMLPHTDGVLCLYHAEQVPVLKTTEINGHSFVEKSYLDALGVVLTRDLVQKIVDTCPATETFDWDWSRYLHAEGYRLLTSQRSYVQHIGIEGFNSDGVLYLHFGKQFYPGHPIVEAHLVEYYDHLLARNDAIVRENIAQVLQRTRSYVRVQEVACVIGSVFVPILRPIYKVMYRFAGTRRLAKSVLNYLTNRLPF